MFLKEKYINIEYMAISIFCDNNSHSVISRWWFIDQTFGSVAGCFCVLVYVCVW